jgi:hypothetical protein
MAPSAQPSSSSVASPAVPAVEDGDAAVSTDVDDPRGPDPNAPKHPDDPVDEPDDPGPGPDVHPVEPVAEPDEPGPGPDVHPDVGFVEVVSEKPVIPPAEQADNEQEVAEPDATDAGTDAPADAAVTEVAEVAAVPAVQEVSKEVALSEAAHHAVAINHDIARQPAQPEGRVNGAIAIEGDGNGDVVRRKVGARRGVIAEARFHMHRDDIELRVKVDSARQRGKV